jgi:hypothetical protein
MNVTIETIEDYEIVKKGTKDVVYYKIHCTYLKSDWYVQKRYNDFVSLHSSVLLLFIESPSCAKKIGHLV